MFHGIMIALLAIALVVAILATLSITAGALSLGWLAIALFIAVFLIEKLTGTT